jgi:hypothetical protein
MGQLDTGDRDGRIRGRLEPSHRRTASFDRAMVLLNNIVEVLASPHFDVTPARMLAPKQLQRAPTRHMPAERHFTWHARISRR